MKKNRRSTEQAIKKYVQELNTYGNNIITVLGQLALLLQLIRPRYSRATFDKKKGIRKQVALLLNIIVASTTINGSNKDIINFLGIVEFLKASFAKRQRSRLRRTRRARRRRRFNGCSVSTLCTYCYLLLQALIFASKEKKLFSELTIADLRAFAKLYRSSIGALLRLLKFQIKDIRICQGLIDFKDPSLHPGKSRTMVSFPAVTPNILETLSSLNMNEKLAILLGFASLREDEIAAINLENISLDTPMPGITVVGKGEKERFIPLKYFPLLFDTLKDAIVRCPNILRKRSGDSFTPKEIATIIRRGLRELNLPLHPQFLRHICVMMLLLIGVPLRDVQSIVGHADEKTTLEEYNHAQVFQVRLIVGDSLIHNNIFDNAPILLSVEETASELQISLRLAQLLAKKGVIKARKSDGQWFFAESDVLEYKLRRSGICCL